MTKYLTPEGMAKLKKELEHLETIGRKEMAKRLKHAASFGDLSENAAYDEAKEAQAFLEGKILELKETIKQAQLVQKKRQVDKVQIGSAVVLTSSNGQEKFQIVGAEEAEPSQGKISYQSPLGKALLGKTIKSKVEVKSNESKITWISSPLR